MTLIESILSATAPVVGSLLPDDADAGGRARPAAPSGRLSPPPSQGAMAPAHVARELDDEVTRLLRVRTGELAEPLQWRRPTLRREVDAVVRQLEPIRTRESLLSSWLRESRHSPPVRLAYAIAWLALLRQAPAIAARRARRRPRMPTLTGAG